MTSTRWLACWGFFWLAWIGATPAFGQIEDVSRCFSPRALDISAIVGAAPTRHVIAVNKGICPIDEETLPTFSLSVTFLNGTGWLSVPSSFTVGLSQVNSFTVTVNYAALPMAGVYQALIIGTESAAAGDQFTVPVTVTLGGQVVDVSPCFSPRALDLSAIVGAAPTQHVISANEQIPDCVDDEPLFVNFSVTFLNGADWLSVPSSVTFARGQLNSFTVTVNYAALPMAGVYQAVIVASGELNPDTRDPFIGTIPVTATLSEPRARLSLSQTTLFYQSVSNGPPTPSQTLAISNEGTGTLSWSLSGLPSWLEASAEVGTAIGGAPGASVALTADPSSFGSGVRSRLVTVSAPGASNNPQLVTVVLLTVPGTTPATAEVSPTALLFVAEQGQPAPPAQTITVSNVGGGTLSYNFAPSATYGGNWLSLAGQDGVAPGQVTVLADPSGLPPGLYRATLIGTFGGGASQGVEVLLIVVPPGSALRTQAVGLPGAAQCAPTEQELLATTIGNGLSLPVSFPRVLTAVVVDDCGSTVTNATVVASVEGLNIPLRALGDGFYSGTWVPVSEAASVTVTFAALHPTFAQVQRSFTVATAAAPGDVSLPTLFADGVVEGAGFTKRRPLAPGGIISLFGLRFAGENNFASQLPLERELAGVSVRIGGQDAPLYFVGSGQINAQVPFEVSTGDSVPVAISVGGLLTAPQNYSIAPTQPGIFIAGENAAILDASFQLVTAQNPARSGDTLQIFCTGLGAVQEQVETGAPAPSFSTVQLPVTVTIGGLAATVVFQGLAPNFVGLYQVNAVVPSGVEPGNAVPLVLTQNGIVANPDRPITIPVQAP